MKKQSSALIAKLLNKNSQPQSQGIHNEHLAEQIVMRSVHDLVPNPKNTAYRTDNIDELAAMIELTHRIEPLIVKQLPDEEGKYMILSGHRRRLAQLYRLESGMTDDPCVPTITREVINPLEEVITGDEMETLNIVFPNKGSRRNLSPVEEAAEIALIKPIIRKIYEYQKERGEIAGKFRAFFASLLDISETTLARKEAIGKLSDAAKEAVEEGRMTATAAAELSALPEEEQDEMLEIIEAQGERPTVETVQRVKEKRQPESVENKMSPVPLSMEEALEAEGQERLSFAIDEVFDATDNDTVDSLGLDDTDVNQWVIAALIHICNTIDRNLEKCRVLGRPDCAKWEARSNILLDVLRKALNEHLEKATELQMKHLSEGEI